MKKRWLKTHNLHKTIRPSIHSLHLSTAEVVLLKFYLRKLWYSDCFENGCNPLEHILLYIKDYLYIYSYWGITQVDDII